MENEIYILLPVHNRKQITLAFVENLKKQTYQNFRLILIDDGSTDGTSEAVLRQLPSSIILYGDGSLWWAGSLQKAINFLKKLSLAPNTPILIINDDTLIPSEFLRNGIIELQSNPRSIICARNNINGKILSSGVHINWSTFTILGTENDALVNCLPTRGIFLTFSDFFQIGGFHPILLPHYLSDYEFTYRAYVRGYKLISPDSFYLSPMLTETGIRAYDHKKGFAYIKLLFSKRCVDNPIYLLIFILLASPPRHKLRNIFDMLTIMSKGILKNLL